MSLKIKNIVGQAARGENFFPRPHILDEIYDRLRAGGNLFLAAPRRVGKTSIMRHLEDNPRQGFIFIYETTESIKTPEDFYKRLLKAILKSDALSTKNRLRSQSQKLWDEITLRVKTLEASSLKIELREPTHKNYEEAFEELISKIELDGVQVILMIDEFPQTIVNITRHLSTEAATDFLQVNRQMRQKVSRHIQFILTGSIGLDVVVGKLGEMKLINDLNKTYVDQLTRKEADDLVNALFRGYDLSCELDALNLILEKVRWLIPFYLQLIFQEIKTLLRKQNMTKANPQIVEEAFQQICSRDNDKDFRSMYDRLEDAFQDQSHKFVLSLLHGLARQDQIHRQDIKALAQKYRVEPIYDTILASLKYDGYLNNERDEDLYQFNSPLLQLWWKRYTSR